MVIVRPALILSVCFSFFFFCSACDPQGESTEIVDALGEVSPPSSLSAPKSSTSGNVELKWGKSPTPSVDGYELEQTTDGARWTIAYRGPGLTTTLRFVTELTVGFRARACILSSRECSATTPVVTVQITPNFPDYLGDSCDPLPVTVPLQEDMGTIIGEAGVSGGAASYRVPLTIAPGRRGVQPSLELVYNSRNSNDVAGVGWSLAGTSRIHRCARTKAQDDEVGSVTFTAVDRLCLDGERLVLIAGSYGSSGSEYRTEIDRFARITMRGAIDAPGAWFEVEEKSGVLSYYGGFEGGPLESYASRTLNWWVRRRQDRQGNSIIYGYSRIAGQFVLTGATYTGVRGAAGDRSISVEYEPRPDKSTRWLAGQMLRTTQRIKAVTSMVQSDVVRRYELVYETSAATGRSLLIGLEECTAAQCSDASARRLPMTTFAYRQEPASYAEEPIEGGDGEFVSVVAGADYDGDGTRDTILREREPGRLGEIVRAEVRLSSGCVWDLTDHELTNGFDRTFNQFPHYGNEDFDRDGRADLLGVNDGLFAIRSVASGCLVREKVSDLPLSGATYLKFVGDFDGNGRSDLLVGENGSAIVYLQNDPPAPDSLSFSPTPIAYPAINGAEMIQGLNDYDGNGLPDAFVDWNSPLIAPAAYRPKIIFTHLSGGTLSFSIHELPSLGGPAPSFSSNSGALGWLDLNGDGLLDIYNLRTSNTPLFWINQGGTFQLAAVTGTIQLHDRLFDDVIAMDYDADGATELLVPSQIVTPWCCNWDNGNGEPLYYCSDSTIDFFLTSAPHQLDRTIYQYDAIELVDDGAGAFTIARVPTPIAVPLGSRVDDYFGDGLPDLPFQIRRLYGEGNGESSDAEPICSGRTDFGNKIVRNHGPLPDLLVSVENGLGAQATWDYAPLSSSGVQGCPADDFYRVNHEDEPDGEHFFFASSMYVVGRFAESDGVGGMSPTCYRYEDAMFNNQGRGLLGFRKIVEEGARGDGQDLRTTTTYQQMFPLVSAPAEITVTLASDPAGALPIRRTENRWESSCTQGLSGDYCFNYIDRVLTTSRELNEPRVWVSTSTAVMIYLPADVIYGNPSSEEMRVSDPTTTFVQRTEYFYDYTDEAAWWINRIERKVVTNESAEYEEPPLVGFAAFPENDRKTVALRYFYYPNAHPTWARLAQAELVQEGVPQQWARTDYLEYDAFGNLTESQVTAADLPQPRAVSFEHTPDGYFVAMQTQALGHVTHFMADPETGDVVSETDPNQLAATKTLDELGRTTEVAISGAPVEHHRVLACDSTCPPRARFQRRRMRDGAPVETEYVDELGRTIETRRTGFDGSSQITEATEYDARGRTIRTSPPSYQAGGAHFTEYQAFDALGRVGRKIVSKAGYRNQQNQPDETFVTEYFHRGPRTRIVLDGVLTAHRTYNAMGQLMKTIDARGGSTSYRYDGKGGLILIEDAAGNSTRARYDDIGRRLSLEDPDRGAWSFDFNGAGELLKQTDANGTAVEMRYDDLGRLVERKVDGAIDASWIFDLTGKGTLDQEITLDRQSGQPLFTRTFGYDPLFRPISKTTRFDGKTYQVGVAYNCYGLVYGIQYPSGEAVELEYTPYGYVSRETNPLAAPGQPSLYREVLAMNARGQVLSERFGNNLYGKYKPIDSTGQIESLCVGTGSGCSAPVLRLDYEYRDPFGNLTSQRKGGSPSVKETFEYDDLHRLERAVRTWSAGGPAAASVDYSYDPLGNIIDKSDYATDYEYGDVSRRKGNAGPHAIVAIDKIGQGKVGDFRYDDNGNLIEGDGREMGYNFSNQPELIVEGGVTTRFAYDPNGARYRQDSAGRITHYVEGIFEAIDTPSVDSQKTYVGSSALVIREGSTRTVRWLHGDRLGSIVTVTDEQGRVVEEHGYDAFGMPRDAAWQDNGGLLHSGQFSSEATTRGFTTHEHLDQHRLIHMNGRTYDPALGRFLSVDPFVQDLANGQSLNPYSYILNNPLSGIDPSGYSAEYDIQRSTQEIKVTPTGSHIAQTYHEVSVTVTDRATGISVTTTHNTFNGASSQTFFDAKGNQIDPAQISSELNKAARSAKDYVEVRGNLERQRDQYEQGTPAWERTNTLLKLHGAALLSPLAAIGIVAAIEAAQLVTLHGVAHIGGAWAAIHGAVVNFLSALVDGPQFAPAGAAGKLVGAAEVADAVGRGVPMLSRGSGARAAGAQALKELGLEGVELSGKSYNAGRKLLENAGFVLHEVTDTGRRVFINQKTGARVLYDSGHALTNGQKPHWHIWDRAGARYNRTGRIVHKSEDGGHIPSR